MLLGILYRWLDFSEYITTEQKWLANWKFKSFTRTQNIQMEIIIISTN